MKAHNTLAVVQLLHAGGAKLDCSAEYELEVVAGLGIPPGDIILNGCGKSERALAAAARLGVREVNVDPLDEARRLNAAARAAGQIVNCTVRVQLGFGRLLARDPSYLGAARAADKFGSDALSGEALDVVRAVVEAPNLAFRGLHHHVVFPGYLADYAADRALAHHAESAVELCGFANEVRSQLGVEVERATQPRRRYPGERLDQRRAARPAGGIHVARAPERSRVRRRGVRRHRGLLRWRWPAARAVRERRTHGVGCSRAARRGE